MFVVFTGIFNYLDEMRLDKKAVDAAAVVLAFASAAKAVSIVPNVIHTFYGCELKFQGTRSSVSS